MVVSARRVPHLLDARRSHATGRPRGDLTGAKPTRDNPLVVAAGDALAGAVAARAGHAYQQLTGGDLDRARGDGALAQPGDEVVVVALEARARDAEGRGELVELLEGAVDGHVAPILDR